ncbi:phosphoadenosine phosphosulfate reductase family protein [Dokdonia sinensis]|nr:phosphoadenosine phosphosulfate reductase family protein [Dokdonia sinensis]
MKAHTPTEIAHLNEKFRKASPEEVVSYAFAKANRAVITTNFRPYEVAILHLVTKNHPEIPVLWCDSGYNTAHTYRHAEELINTLSLNIQLFVPKQTVAHRNITLGIPEVDTPEHVLFTEQVKLEPFKRAMQTFQPDVWFTNLRKGQTALRDTLDIFSTDKKGVLKVSPFYHYDDKALDTYLEQYQLPNEFNYYDPTKALENRECGIHL